MVSDSNTSPELTLMQQLQKWLQHFGVNVGVAQPEAKELAVIGGGLAGMMSAYQANAKDPSLHITLYERGSEQSYSHGADDSHRASLSASPARIIRYVGNEDALGLWRVQETKRAIEQLQAELDANPQDYPGLARVQLLRPQASVTIAPGAECDKHKKLLKDMRERGIGCTELSGKELKERFPGLYNGVADDAAAVVQEPMGEGNNVSAIMNVEAILKAMKTYLQKRGVSFAYNAQVDYVHNNEAGVEIGMAGGKVVQAGHAIIAPGQWLETIKDKSGESLTRKAGIKPRFDRVVVLDIDARAMGLPEGSIPFTKDATAGAADGSFYSHQPDAASGHIKFMPASMLTSVKDVGELHRPLSDAEIETALDIAAKRFAVDKELLRAHTSFSSCAYTSPAKKERVLVAPLDTHITLLGLDSSSLARSSAGYGAIAASLALGKDEPHAGAYKATSLEAHHELINSPDVIEKPALCNVVASREMPRTMLSGAAIAL